MTDTPVIGSVDAPLLHVMSYNIRRRMPHIGRRNPDRWEHRRPLLRRLLEDERPTVLGVQEALPDQEGFVLDSLGDGYRSIGYGRDPGKNAERCPMFWDSRRLQLQHWTQSALSDSPEVPGSRTWGNKDPRVLVSAVFLDLATDRELSVINTHFDHRSPNARLQSGRVIRHLVAGSPRPTVVTGDFNSDIGSIGYRALTGTGMLRDSWTVAEHRATEAWGTFPNYRAPKHERKRIDWILATPNIEVLTAAINTTRFDGAWPSDHAPVQAVVQLIG